LQHVGIKDEFGRTQMLATTDEHPFYVVGSGWTPSKLLNGGDVLSGTAEFVSVVLSNVRENQPGGAVVYNMEIEGAHSYFVRADGSTAEPVWVHNAADYELDAMREDLAEMDPLDYEYYGGRTRVSCLILATIRLNIIASCLEACDRPRKRPVAIRHVFCNCSKNTSRHRFGTTQRC
jgi:hypothetical protein